LKDKDKLPRIRGAMNRMMDDTLKSFSVGRNAGPPWCRLPETSDEGDVDALVVFYRALQARKLIKEMPQITAEAMQEMLPLMRKSMDQMTQRMQEEVAAMVRSLRARRKDEPANK